MPDSYIKRILEARIYDLVSETPLDYAHQMSQRLNNHVYFKREDLQPVFSFKIRGAYNKLCKLSEEQRQKGVIAASAGNHAQGLAMGAKKLGITATIVMPKTTPTIKVDAVRARGANVVLFGENFDLAAAHSQELAEQHGYTYVHPFDDPDVIAGQGTIGMELVRQCPTVIDTIFIAVGGGGLCAGVGAYLKYVNPNIRIVAVEFEESACLKLAMETGERRVLDQVGLFADGVAVAQIGKETFRVLKDLVDEVITVSSDEICAAVKDIFEDTRSIVEPAGALSLAGMKKYVAREGTRDQTLVGINCGANMNFDRLRYISERTEIGEKREAVLAVTIPEIAGSFERFCQCLASRNITEFNYRYADTDDAHIYVGVQVLSDQDRHALIQQLQDAEYPVLDLTDNEMAKLHIRHMVGGHSPKLKDERLYRFEFPERPGALMGFLKRLGNRWNISLFHYRNHGAADGRVLLGVEVPEDDVAHVTDVLDSMNYSYVDETRNPAYQLFVR